MKLTFSLLVRNHCHLCGDMALAFNQWNADQQYMIKNIDIDSSSELKEKYDTQIPLLMYKDDIICRYFFDEAALQHWITINAET